jgi:catechol-2,3-dioxygenase
MIGFKKDKHDLGGVIAIGVSNIEKSIEFYQTILGLDTYFMISKSMKIIIISELDP